MDFAGKSIRNRTTSLVLTVVAVVGGLVAFETLSRLEDPEFTIKDAKVITAYPGATAREVEEEVTDVLEKAAQQLGQLKRVTSKSKPGLSILTVTIKDEFGSDALPQVWDELRRKIGDAQGKLPPGAGPSIVNDDFGDVFGVFFAVYGDGFSYRELKEHVDMLEKELLLVPNVSKVAVYAAQPEAIYIEMSRARMGQLGVSEWQIYSTLAGKNSVAPGGQVEVGPEYIRIVPLPGVASVEAIGKTLIQGVASERQIYLEDVADIRRGYQDPPDQVLHFNGRPAIGVGISTVKGGDVVAMGQAVADRLRELEAETPVGIETGVIYWQSKYVTTAISSFVVSLLQALAIVVGILLFAMGLRSGLLIGIVLLLTVLATFIPMKIQGIALERISLGALIIALGMLVDNAIVVVEGIQIRIEAGMERVQAAVDVVKGTMWPLLGGTFVAILAFGALGFSTDNTGEFCRSLFLVITISLLLSWLIAVTVTPLLAVMMIKGKPEGGDEAPKDPYGGAMFRGYRGLLETLIRRRWLTLGILALLLAVAVKGFGFIESSFFPDSTTPQFTVDYWVPQGAFLGRTNGELEQIEEFVLGSDKIGRDARIDPPTDAHPWQDGLPGVQNAATCVGGGALRFMLTYAPEEPNSAYGQLIIEVEDYTQITDLIPRIEGYIQDAFPESLAYARRFVLGPGGGSKIEARFRGPDPAVLRRLSEEAKGIMASDIGARDVRDDWREKVKVVRPVVAEGPAARAGLTREDISRATQRTFGGARVGVYREDDKLIPIIARAPAEERGDVANLEGVQVWSTVAGRAIPIRQVVSEFETRFEDAILGRRNRLPTIIPQCNQASGNASVLFDRLRPRIEGISLPPGYSMEWGGEYENSQNGAKGLAATFPLMILLMVLIVIVQFNSLRLPAIIWLTVPLAIIGVTAGLLVAGQPFGFMALLGALSLIGMLVKNSIVLVDEIKAQNLEGKELYTAILDASSSRLRPVSMAALTTVLGMIPLLPDAFFVSMAVTVMAGLTFATILTLIVIPVLFATFFFVKAPSSS